MARLILRVRRGGRLLGSWGLGEDPLEFSVVDVMTGRELASFSASGDPGGLDEVPIDKPERLEGDDLTMPLPEPTDTEDAPQTDKIPIPVSVRRLSGKAVGPLNLALPDLAARLVMARQDGDDFTVPLPEPTPTADLPIGFEDALGDEDSDAELSDLSVSGHSLDEVIELRPTSADEERSVSIGRHMLLDDDDDEGPEITLGEPVSGTQEIPVELDRPTDVGQPPVNAFDAALAEFDTQKMAAVRVPPAEVWVRRHNEWHPAGHLVPGQRVLNLGGWVRLATDGRVIVCSGPRLDGSATLLDGRTVGITASDDAVSLPPGASVVLRHGEAGLYIRTEPLADRAGRVAYDKPPTQPAGSSWRR